MQTFGEKVDDIDGYKYLGVLEDSRSILKPENKTKIESKILTRVTKICQTKLNAKNLFAAINEFAISTINYHIGLIPFEQSEYETIDKKIRQILCDQKITRNASNNDRLYLSRNEMGRGLQNISDIEVGSRDYERNEILEIEKRNGSHLGLITEYISNKYGFEGQRQVSEVEVRIKYGSKLNQIFCLGTFLYTDLCYWS